MELAHILRVTGRFGSCSGGGSACNTVAFVSFLERGAKEGAESWQIVLVAL